MTREVFLDELRKALEGLKDEELEGVLAYYAEMIDDRMEAGMSEEAAVKAMEPVSVIAARVRSEAGVEEPVKKSDDQEQIIRRAQADVRELQILAECKAVEIQSAEGDEIVLHYHISDNDVFSLHEDQGVLMLEHKIRPVSSFANEQGGGFSLDKITSLEGLFNEVSRFVSRVGTSISRSLGENAPIVVELPQAFRSRLTVNTSNARITMEDLNCVQPVKLTTSNARIAMNDVTSAAEITLNTSNGRIELNDVNASGMRLVTSNGRIVLEDVLARAEIDAATSNNGITVEDTVCEGKMSLRTSNGKVELNDSVAPDINIHTSNGTVGGVIKARQDEYTVQSATRNASNALGNREGGEKVLHVVTSNAPITLRFAE